MRNQDMMEPFYWAPTPKFGGGWIAYKSSKTPPAPDYKAAAEATAAGNLEVAKYTTEANRADQIDPWGQVTWTQEKSSGFDQAGYDRALDQYYKDLDKYNQQRDAAASGGVGGFIFRNTKPPVMPDRNKFVTSGEGKWTQTTTLAPEAQAALDSQLAVQMGRSQAAENLLGKVQGQLETPLDTSSALAWQTQMPEYDEAMVDRYAKAVFDRQASMLNPQYQQQEERMRNNLALQGLSNTAEAYQTDIGNFSRSRNEAYNNLANQSLLTGRQFADSDYQRRLGELQLNNTIRGQQLSEMAELYNMPLGQLNALLTGQQVKSPTFSNYYQQQQVAGPDYLSAAQMDYSTQLAAANAKNAQQGGLMSGIGSLAGAGLGAYFGGLDGAQLGSKVGGSVFSDRRLKRNIVRVGATPRGLNVYSYKYIWSDEPQIGVMADEAETVFPEAVTVHESGYKMVNYSLIG